MQKYPMTVDGHATLEAELKNLKSVERPYIINAISVAREHGDLSENAEYHAAKEKQGFIEGRIQELESKLSLAQVIDTSVMSGETVKFGAIVKRSQPASAVISPIFLNDAPITTVLNPCSLYQL